MGCNCNNPQKKYKNVCGANTPPVLEVHSEECPVLFHTVNIPASVGNITTIPPTPGAYRNARVFYEADEVAYLYDSDGIPQLLTVPGPTGGVNSVNGKTGEVILDASDVSAQPILTAGAGIDITGVTISATNIINGGTSAPTTSTVGAIGALYSYVDSGTGHLAICTAVSDSTYTWSTLI